VSAAPTVLHSPLALCLAALCAWLCLGVLATLRPAHRGWLCGALLPAGACAGLALAGVAIASLGAAPERITLLIGLPDLPMHLRLDALSAVFLVLLGGASAGVSLFAADYFRHPASGSPGLIGLQYHLFLASMGFVLLADDAYSFMLGWESMALSSYFLVATEHDAPWVRQAAFLYLLIAHVGALAILLSFGVLQGGSWQFTFDAMRAARLSAPWSAAALLLALFGFGAKAGLVPLHVWLPEAHPAAPSPVSALLSGVMLKMALYGMVRVSLDLIAAPAWWCGLVLLGIGLYTALHGVVFAAAQSDMKRLLAYSSIENSGILATGLGLALVFQGVGMRGVAALALLAALYHALNHAFMKSLLFLGAGGVLQVTGERDMGRLGGLIHRMPWLAWTSLAGALALAGLPPLNGFVSEWLLLQAFLFAPEVPRTFVNMLLPMGAALLVLAAALAAYVMVKFFGVVFLGRARTAAGSEAHDPGLLARVGLLWLAAGCVLLGVLPAQILPRLRFVAALLRLDDGRGPGGAGPWWSLAPLPDRQASYAPLVFLATIAGMILLTIYVVRRLYHQRVRRAEAWDCGYGRLSARVQDSPEGFGQPIRHIFEPFFVLERELPSPFDAAPRYRVRIGDRWWRGLYQPIGALVRGIADRVAWLQQGRIAAYLLYSFLTLLLLLAFVL
jgi:formate hydrogenlyase subunit 3/multisubunit Na+/H+ antiporter MnhD subunit